MTTAVKIVNIQKTVFPMEQLLGSCDVEHVVIDTEHMDKMCKMKELNAEDPMRLYPRARERKGQ